MKKPKFYVKPFWMVRSTKESTSCYGISRPSWEAIRRVNAKPVLKNDNLKYYDVEFEGSKLCFTVKAEHLTKRLFIEQEENDNG